MNHDDEVRLITGFLDHHARRESIKAGAVTTVSVDAYRSPQIHRAEREALFRGRPQFIGLSADLPGPGTFCTRADLVVPTVLTRDEAGRARAFANVCRHRGAEVARGRGDARQLSCPYHAWTYGLDGTLRRIPDAEAFPDVDPACHGLKELPLIERHGMLWVLPDPAAAETESGEGALGLGPHDLGLAGLEAELAQLELGTFTWWRSERLELDLNWKLVIETFLEPYHFASLHRITVGPYFLANLCSVEQFGDHAREVLPRRTMLDLAGTPTEQWRLLPHAVLVHVLFPGTAFVWLLDHIETWRVTPHPTDPNRCVTELDFYLPAQNDRPEEYWEKNWAQTITTVLTEDFPAMAGVQRGLDSGANTHFTVGRNEPALALFQQAVARGLAGHAVPPIQASDEAPDEPSVEPKVGGSAPCR